MRPRADRDGWARRYKAGETLRDIAASAGVCMSTVHRRLVADGVPMRRPGTRLDRRKPAPEVWAKLYRAGKSLRQVAAEVGVAHTAVLHQLRQQGVQLRPRGGPRRRALPAWYGTAAELRARGLLHREIAEQLHKARVSVTRALLRTEGAGSR